MLKPAILYKDLIIQCFQERFYTEDMMFETSHNGNWSPEIFDCPDETQFQYAVVNSEEELIGYISFRIDWYASVAYNFGLISFDKGNVLMGYGLREVMDMIINDFKLHKIEWKMVSGNPAQSSYDRFLKAYNGNKVIHHDDFKDKYGKYHDSIYYEIILDN